MSFSRVLSVAARTAAFATGCPWTTARGTQRSGAAERSSVPSVTAVPGIKIVGFEFRNERTETGSAIATLAEVLKRFGQEDPSFMERFSESTATPKRRVVARTPDELFDRAKERAEFGLSGTTARPERLQADVRQSSNSPQPIQAPSAAANAVPQKAAFASFRSLRSSPQFSRSPNAGGTVSLSRMGNPTE